MHYHVPKGSKIKISEIDSMVEKGKCPARMYCTVATTYHTPEDRERKCLKCWLDYCKDKKYEIDYEEN